MLREKIESLLEKSEFDDGDRELFAEFREALRRGEIRAAEKSKNGIWQTNRWVKRGILLGFRMGRMVEMSKDTESFQFFDKDTYPPRPMSVEDRIRIVPGGTIIRDGSYVAENVVLMPPCYINVGAYVDEGTMIDSHALVGSCAQIGKRVHLSAAAQIGGVLEPVGNVPVVIEDEVVVGGNSGIYEGTIVRGRAVIGAGVSLTGSTPVYDLVRGQIYRKTPERPLEIPYA